MHYMREFVSTLDPDAEGYYGRRLQYGGRPGKEETFVSGGCGQLLSRASVRKMGSLVEENPNNWAAPINGPSDLMTCRTLYAMGIHALDSRDEQLRHRFIVIGLDAEHTLTRKSYPTMWLWTYSNETREGMDCCSDKWIATHYVRQGQVMLCASIAA